MLIRVLSRGLFFRRGSQVDFTGGPLGDRQINVEDIKVIHPPPDNVGETATLEDKPHEGPQKLLKKAAQTVGPDVENHPIVPDAIRSRRDNTLSDHASIIDNSGPAPYVFGDAAEAIMKGPDEADDADEAFQTPLHQTPFLGHPEYGSSTKQRFIEHFDDAPCPSKAPSPDGPTVMPTIDSRPTQGILSDITEADESGAQDLSTQDSKPSPNLLRVRSLSFSSFGSSYPSSCFGSPALNTLPPCGITATCAETLCPEATLSASSSAHHVGLAQSTVRPVPDEAAKPVERPSTPDSPTSDFVPFVVEPLLSSKSVVRLAEDEGHVDERKDEHEADDAPVPTTTNVVPSASTYADATNLALQHPEMASDILRQPLSSATASGCPSKFPTPSVSCSVSLQVVPPASATCTPIRAGTPHKAERPNWALAPDANTPSRPSFAVAPKAHTAERPNWALARDEQKATPGRRSRSRGRGQDRSGSRPPSLARGTEQRILRGGRSSNADQDEPAPRTVPASAVVSPKQKSECGAAVPSKAPDLEDGPQQWLNRVNSWVEQTSRGPKTCPDTPYRDSDATCSNTLPPPSKEPIIQPQGHSRTTSGLNPHAPAWSPAPRVRCQTPTDSDSAPPATQSESSPSTASVRGPFTFGVDADIDRLRDMLRSCGIQDRDGDTGSIRNDSSTSGSTPSGPEKAEGVALNEGSQKTTVPCETREASRTAGHLDTRGTLHPQPEAPRQGFEFTTPTRLGPPFSLAGATPGRPSPFPQSFLATPPRLAFQRANAQYFRKEPGGPWISGFFDPNAPSSGASFPQPSPASPSFTGSAPGPAHLSFSQASRSFSRTCQPEPGSFHVQGSPPPFVPGSYKVRVNCVEREPDVPAPAYDAPASPFTAGTKRPRQPTVGSLTSNFKSQRFA